MANNREVILRVIHALVKTTEGMEIKTITLAPVDENIANYDGLKTGNINEYSFELMNTSNKGNESFKHRAGGNRPGL